MGFEYMGASTQLSKGVNVVNTATERDSVYLIYDIVQRKGQWTIMNKDTHILKLILFYKHCTQLLNKQSKNL